MSIEIKTGVPMPPLTQGDHNRTQLGEWVRTAKVGQSIHGLTRQQRDSISTISCYIGLRGMFTSRKSDGETYGVWFLGEKNAAEIIAEAKR